MKKQFFVLAALLLSTMALFAQETDVNFALASNGATATASSGTPNLAIDGNNGTRWESAHGNDAEWFVVNLGQSRTFNTVQLRWEGAYGKSFTIDYSTDSTTWDNFATITDQTLAGFPYEQTLDVATPVSAQYVRFQGVARGTGYGYSFWEFRVFKASSSVLTSIEAKPAADICKVGEEVAINSVARDQNGKQMSSIEYEYTISPADAGEVKEGKFKPAKGGLATITVKSGDVSATAFTIYAYEGENVALSPNINESKVIAQSDFAPSGTDAFHAVDGNVGSAWQGSATNGTDGDEAARTFDAWFVVDLGAFYDINLVTIQFEGACSQAYHLDFSADNTNWNLAHNYEGTAGVNGHTDMLYGDNLQNNTSVRYVRFWSTKAATQWGMKIFEMQVFGTQGQAPDDDEKPVMVSATLVSSNYNSAVIAVEATDNMAVAKYNVKDAANDFNASFNATEGQITVVGLKTNTTYNLAITAVDLAGNESEEAKTIQVITPVYNPTPTTAAPVPAHEADKVMSIYSDTYTPCTQVEGLNQNWYNPPFMDENEIEGNNYLRYHTNMNGMVGWQFSAANPIDASKMKYLHVDIWPSVTGTIVVGPTYGGDGKTTYVQQITLNVEQEKWNSFDIQLTDYPELDLTSIFQNQFTAYSAQSEFSVDNFYFWTDGTTTIVDATEVFPKVVKAIENGQVVIIRDGVRYNVMGNVIR